MTWKLPFLLLFLLHDFLKVNNFHKNHYTYRNKYISTLFCLVFWGKYSNSQQFSANGIPAIYTFSCLLSWKLPEGAGTRGGTDCYYSKYLYLLAWNQVELYWRDGGRKIGLLRHTLHIFLRISEPRVQNKNEIWDKTVLIFWFKIFKKLALKGPQQI